MYFATPKFIKTMAHPDDLAQPLICCSAPNVVSDGVICPATTDVAVAGDGSTGMEACGDGDGVAFGGVYCSISSGVPIVSVGSLRRRSSRPLSFIDSGLSC